MDIFTGIEILFYMMGVVSVLLILGLHSLSRKYPFRWPAMTLALIGIFGILFTLMWSFSSLMEGELRSAIVGFAMFGVPSIILFAAARRLVVKSIKGPIQEAPKVG